MKTKSLLAVLLATGLLAGASAWAQNAAKHVSANSAVQVTTAHGSTVVTVNGKEVYRGPVKGHVSSRSHNVNGLEYSAVYDGRDVLWENVPGAADKLAASAPAQVEANKLPGPHQSTAKGKSGGTAHSSVTTGGKSVIHSSSTSSAGGVTVKTVDGVSTAFYQGKEIPLGEAKGAISVKSKTLHGVEYTAIFDGHKLLWENVPGAGDKVR